MKHILATIVAASLAIGGVVAVGGPATAGGPKDDTLRALRA